MNPNTQRLHALGQSLWLDNISREMLTNGTLARYIEDLSATGLTSNPTIFEKAIGGGTLYDQAIGELTCQGKSGEDLFFALALQDLRQAADLFRPAHDATDGVDGWVSLELSPLLADDTAESIRAASRLHVAGGRKNLFIKIPGTPRPCSRSSGAKASTTRRWPNGCSVKAPTRSRSPGRRCCRASTRRARSSPRRARADDARTRKRDRTATRARQLDQRADPALSQHAGSISSDIPTAP